MTTHSLSEHAGPPRAAAAHALGLNELPEPRSDGEPVIDANPLHAVKATFRVCVGHLELTVGELLEATQDQVFSLDRTLHQPVDLILEGQVVARGQLVAVDGHFGIKLTELATPLTR